jgi:DNA-binding NarL/FixJ family response regulator
MHGSGGHEVTGHSCTSEHNRARSITTGIRVLLVDDHPLVRATLVEVLSDEDDLTVVGECEDGSQVLEAAARLRPDVVLMDLSMPVMNGLAATEALRAAQPEPRIVVLTGEGPTARPKVAAAGAHALLPKDARADALLRCLRAVVDGCGCCPHCL